MWKPYAGRLLVGSLSGFVVCLAALPAFAQVPPVAHDPMEGASCTAPADCGGKLNCVNQKCVSPSAANDGGSSTPQSGGSRSSGEGRRHHRRGSDDDDDGGGSGKSWKGFEGLRPFAGLTLGGGPTFASAGGRSTTVGGFLFGLKGGILYDHIEAGAEISPVTFLPNTGFGGKPVLQANLYGGYHIPLAKLGSLGELTYPLRGGIGVAGVNTGGQAFFEGRLDLIGVSAIVGPVLLDLHLPSWRIFANGNGYFMHFMFGIGGAILPDAF